MPKVNLGKSVPKEVPPIDWLWAAILERMRVYHYSLHDLAKIGFVSYGSMRELIRKSPWAWPKQTRDLICDALGIVPIQSVFGAPMEDLRA